MTKIPISYNLRSLKERKTSTMVAVFCIAGVVAVFIAVMSMAEGFRHALVTTGSPDNAIVLRGGSTSEMTSVVTLDQAKIIADAPGVARDAKGIAKVSREVVVVASLKMKSTDTDANIQLRGVSDTVLAVRDNVVIKKGRLFKAGLPEVVVGKNASLLYQNMALNDTIAIGGQDWKVVGILDCDGGAFDSEVWCDSNVLNQTYRRPLNIFQSMTVKLESAVSLKAFKDHLTTDPRLTVDVESELSYYERQSRMLATLINVLGFLIAGVMAVGAIFGALNTMYAAISSRAAEIATLRALGFPGSSVVVSFVLESLVIAFMGGIVGCVIILPLNGFTASTINWSTFSQLAFAFKVTPVLMVKGIVFALFMGVFGGYLPALRASKASITATLRGM
ncbi:MAG: FtsX-like permease family protein [bacterium]|nr:FtsX-like permease family protein [bacterium]